MKSQHFHNPLRIQTVPIVISTNTICFHVPCQSHTSLDMKKLTEMGKIEEDSITLDPALLWPASQDLSLLQDPVC